MVAHQDGILQCFISCVLHFLGSWSWPKWGSRSYMLLRLELNAFLMYICKSVNQMLYCHGGWSWPGSHRPDCHLLRCHLTLPLVSYQPPSNCHLRGLLTATCHICWSLIALMPAKFNSLCQLLTAFNLHHCHPVACLPATTCHSCCQPPPWWKVSVKTAAMH